MSATLRALPLGQLNKTVARGPRAFSLGGLAYRLFLWLLPVGLLLGGALGLSNAESTEDAVKDGGLPGAITNAIGDAARSAHSDSWWLFAVGVPLLLWAGFSGAKAVQLVHVLVLDGPPPKTEVSTGITCLHGYGLCGLRSGVPTLAVFVVSGPASSLLSSRSLRSRAWWLWVSSSPSPQGRQLAEAGPRGAPCPIGFQVLHAVIGSFQVPKLESRRRCTAISAPRRRSCSSCS